MFISSKELDRLGDILVENGLLQGLLRRATDSHPTGLEGCRQPKVPTLIMYDQKDPSKFKWGGEVDWRDPAVRGVKLLLDPDQDRPVYLPMSSFRNDLQALSKSPVDVAADFIGAIYNHALSIVKSAVLQNYFDFCQKDFVLSVPAVWSDKAKDLTLQASTFSVIVSIVKLTIYCKQRLPGGPESILSL